MHEKDLKSKKIRNSREKHKKKGGGGGKKRDRKGHTLKGGDVKGSDKSDWGKTARGYRRKLGGETERAGNASSKLKGNNKENPIKRLSGGLPLRYRKKKKRKGQRKGEVKEPPARSFCGLYVAGLEKGTGIKSGRQGDRGYPERNRMIPSTITSGGPRQTGRKIGTFWWKG